MLKVQEKPVLLPEEFKRLVTAAYDLIPDEFRLRMENIAVIVELEPSADQLARGRVPKGGTLFGLYEGRPLTVRSVFESFAMPDRITIFQGPHERAARSPEHLAKLVEDTIWHEVAHYFAGSERIAGCVAVERFPRPYSIDQTGLRGFAPRRSLQVCRGSITPASTRCTTRLIAIEVDVPQIPRRVPLRLHDRCRISVSAGSQRCAFHQNGSPVTGSPRYHYASDFSCRCDRNCSRRVPYHFTSAWKSTGAPSEASRTPHWRRRSTGMLGPASLNGCSISALSRWYRLISPHAVFQLPKSACNLSDAAASDRTSSSPGALCAPATLPQRHPCPRRIAGQQLASRTSSPQTWPPRWTPPTPRPTADPTGAVVRSASSASSASRRIARLASRPTL